MAYSTMVCMLLTLALGMLPLSAAAAYRPANAVMGDPVRTLLAAEADFTVVQITFPVQTAPKNWAAAANIEWSGIVTEIHSPDTGLPEPITAAYGLHVAVSRKAAPTWRVAAVQWHRQPNESAGPIAAVGDPLIYRGIALAPVQVFVEAGGGILAGLILEFQHPAPADLGKSLDDPLIRRRAVAEVAPRSLINPAHFRDLRAWSMSGSQAADATQPFGPFAQTENWVRLEVAQTGIYALSGLQLEQLGLDLAHIHPATLRLFKGGGLALDPDPSLPDSEQADRVGLTEIPIDVHVNVEGDFHADDRLLFYGFGTDVWLDRLVADAEPLEHYNHPFQDRGVYWLTWEAQTLPWSFEGPPLRIGPPHVAMPAGVEVITTHRARYHGEQNLVYLGGFVRDNWVWNSRINHSFTQTAVLSGVVPDASNDWQVDFCGTSHTQWFSQLRTTITINDDQDGSVTRVWTMNADQRGSEQVRISGTTNSLRNGSNTVRLQNDSFADTSVFMAMDSFDLLYQATLNKNDYPGVVLTSVFWGDEVPDAAAVHDVRYTLPASGHVQLWDVTQPQAAFALTGALSDGPPRTLTLSLQRDPGQTRHLVLFGESDLMTVERASVANVRPLRRELSPVDYVVIHPAPFSAAAERLVNLRSRTLPAVVSPAAAAVSLEDIYANFSGGQKDWRAIRQFLRWHFYDLPDGQRLQWVCLLGNASRDYRNYAGANPAVDFFDWVPTEVVTNFPNLFTTTSLTYPYAADQALAALDAPLNPNIGFDIPDLAVGRLPANSLAEALMMVEQTRIYAEEPPPGPWSNSVTFCADDLIGSYLPTTERKHMDQAERLASLFLPRSLETGKIYLDDYPFEGPNNKPAARRALLSALNAGTTIFYYVGHGSSLQLADEQVFRSDFIPGLTNGGRRFIFMAFSCDVGVFDDPNSRSMAEQFLLSTQGGAIASIAASWISHISQNDLLSSAFFQALYPQQPHPSVDPAVSVGEALRAGKISIWTGRDAVRNAMRYNMIGDPALRLANPVDDLLFTADSADSLLSGRLHLVKVDLSSGGMHRHTGGDYQLLAQESSSAVPYTLFPGSTWNRAGNQVFRGTGSLAGDHPAVAFLAPLSMRTGERGRIRLVVNDGGDSRAAFLQVPVVLTSADPGQDTHGPDIRLAFAGGRLRVQTGAELTATLFDTSGISILATNPANSVLMEFNSSGIYTNVSDAVVFDPGSYTRARLTTSLPQDLELGQHQLVMTASDMFGNVGSDTLRFYLETAGLAAMRDAAVFPNPTAGPCRLICDLTVPMDLRWDIYTVSGRRIRNIREHSLPAGPVILEWDGRDGEGDAIANGVYLYVLRGTMPGSGQELRETGQIVIMR